MEKGEIAYQPLGDRAFTLKWNEAAPPLVLAAKAQAIGRLHLRWLQEIVPAYCTLTFYLQDHEYSPQQAAQIILNLLAGLVDEQLHLPKLVELPVVYGGEVGPDLTECALRSGLSEQQFIDRHSETTYQVALIGFAPGFPYLSGLDRMLAQPRRANPRLKVPAGSVGIAGNQSGVYSVHSPGGWKIIGRTSVSLFQPEAREPFLLAPGDMVKFVPVDRFEDSIYEEDTAAIEESKRMDNSDSLSTVSLKVLKPGLLTTIQDLGRKGMQAFGVSVGGAMDGMAIRTANLLIGNEENDAVLELTLAGGSYRVELDTVIALCGANLDASVNGMRLPMNRPVWLQEGTILTFGRSLSGSRCYMAIAGGIDVPFVLGSRSADLRARLGGGFGRALVEGDKINILQPTTRTKELQQFLFRKAQAKETVWSSVSWHAGMSSFSREIKVRVLLGSEWNTFLSESQISLFQGKYRLESSSDRMGLRITGPALLRQSNEELKSHGVTPGTVQVPPNGQPIILGVGCQPTGGYPKIAHVISADMPMIAQAMPGDWISFELTDSGTAQRALLLQDRKLAIVRAGIQLALERDIHIEGVRE